MQSSRTLSFAALVLVSLAWGVAGGAQPPDPAPAPDPDTPKSIFTDTTEVHLVDIDVVVANRRGEPVHGLTPDDFELIENGKERPIDHFTAVEGGDPVLARIDGATVLPLEGPPAEEEGAPAAATAPVPPAGPEALHLVVFVDQVSLDKPSRDRALLHLREALDRSLEGAAENARVMVVTNDRGIHVRQGFTSDQRRVGRVLTALEDTQTAGFGADAELRDLVRTITNINSDRGNSYVQTKGFNQSGPLAENIFGDPSQPGGSPGDPSGRQGAEQRQERLAEIARVQMETESLIPQIIGYAERRRIETQATGEILGGFLESLAGLPGRKALLYVSGGLSLNPAQALFETFENRIAGIDNLGRSAVLAREIERFDQSRLFEDLMDRATSSGVTFYAVDASPPAILNRGSAANVGSTGLGNEARASSQLDTLEERNRHEGLQRVAEETGGRASLASADLDAALTSFLEDFRNHYSLGYEVDSFQPDTVREIEVRLTREAKRRIGRGATVRHRRQVKDRTEEERMADRTLSALMMDVYDNPLQVEVTTAEEQPAENGNYAVPVEIRVPLGKLVLLPGESMHQARVDLYVAVLDEKGRTSPVARQLCPIRVPNEDLLVALGRDAGCGVRLLMRPGKQRIAVGVHDRIAARRSTVAVDVAVGEAPVSEASSEAPGAR